MQILNILEPYSKPLLRVKKPKIYITAANSFIAKNILEQLDYNFTATTHNELDLTDEFAVSEFFADKYFDFVIHTANVGGRRNKPDSQEQLDANVEMFLNLLHNSSHYKYLINIGSGADKLNTWYGRSKRIIAGIIKEHTNMINLRCFGVWGKYEAPDRFPTVCANNKQVTIEDKLMRYIYIDDLVKIVDETIKNWPKEREMTLGEPILLSEFARQLNPDIKIIEKGKGQDYI